MKTLNQIRALAKQADTTEHVICWNYIDACEDVSNELETMIEQLKDAPLYYQSPWKIALETPDVAEYVQKAIEALGKAQQLCVDEGWSYYELDNVLGSEEYDSAEL